MEAISPDTMTADEMAEAFDDWMGDETYIPTLTVVGEPDAASAELRRLALQDGASVLLWRIRKAERELQRVEQLASAGRQRIDEFVEKKSAGPRFVVEDAKRQLEAIARQIIGEKETGISVPNGRLTLRKASTRLVVVDEAAAIAYLRAGIDAGTTPHDVLRVKTEVSLTALKAYAAPVIDDAFSEPVDGKRTAPAVIDDGGETVPGVQFERNAERTFEYAVAK